MNTSLLSMNLEADLAQIKSHCVWCLIPMPKSEKRYMERGNMCLECSSLIGRVAGKNVKNPLSRERCAEIMADKRKANKMSGEQL